MNKLARLYASLEAEAVVINELEEDDSSVNSIDAEIKVECDKVIQLGVDSDELGDVAEGVEKIAEEMRVIIADGDFLSVESAAFARIAINAYTSKIGLTPYYVISSLEAFVTPTISIEETSKVLTTLKSIGNTIYQTLLKAWEFMKNVFHKLFGDIYSKLPAYIEKNKTLITRVRVLDFGINKAVVTTGKEKFTASEKDLNNVVYDNNTSFEYIKKGLDNIITYSKGWYPEYIKAIDKIFKTRLQTTKNATFRYKDDILVDHVAAEWEEKKIFYRFITSNNINTDYDNLTDYENLTAKLGNSGEYDRWKDIISGNNKFKWVNRFQTPAFVAEPIKLAKDKTFNTFTLKECRNLLETTNSILDSMRDMKPVLELKDFFKNGDEIMALLKKTALEKESNDPVVVEKAFKKLESAKKNKYKTLTGCIVQFFKIAMNASNSTMNLCEASLNNYTEQA